MSNLLEWVDKTRADREPWDDEPQKAVTIRLSAFDFHKLGLIAAAVNKTRTGAATGILEAALSDVLEELGLVVEDDPWEACNQ